MTVEANRVSFLAALRSGTYLKGPIEIDAQGRPRDRSQPGYCVDGLAYCLFGTGTVKSARLALGVSPAEFAHWQQVWNDSELTFCQIADHIEASWR